ncbi:phosphopantetheine-binding protein [Streptomyces sp. B15]|uniref:phosphopantetheine-binding protein n=1 Tax=Streptomyces sp. B15 TaxID=1537797 RepID=UPI0034D65486
MLPLSAPSVAAQYLEQRVRPPIPETFGVPLAQVTATARLLEDLGAGDLDLAMLRLLLEDDFGIRISAADTDEVVTVRDVINMSAGWSAEQRACRCPALPGRPGVGAGGGSRAGWGGRACVLVAAGPQLAGHERLRPAVHLRRLQR